MSKSVANALLQLKIAIFRLQLIFLDAKFAQMDINWIKMFCFATLKKKDV